MIYSKLPIVFLSTIASEKEGSTNSVIASYILNHMEEMKEMGIKDIADSCNVAISSISRFCKEIGLRSFAELKELLVTNEFYFEQYAKEESPTNRVVEYTNKVKESIDMVVQSISIHKILELCQDIKKYQRVAIFGLLKAESVALNLQGDLLMLGKQVYTNLAYSQQLEYIKSAQVGDLIIILSYTGSYFEYQGNREVMRWSKKGPKIWMIAGEEKTYPDCVTDVISFHSYQDQASHPHQLQMIASVLAQEYARIVEE